ncbi:hypothetical protein MP228_007877 [Amoeboaphelidium protococcarum]|nr:hypothetical protein MP228_007877 [Amoeboaphelidium protococcarum]
MPAQSSNNQNASASNQSGKSSNLFAFNVAVPYIVSVGVDVSKTSVGVKGQWGQYKERAVNVPVPELVQRSAAYGYSFVAPYAQWTYKKVFEPTPAAAAAQKAN